MIIARTAPNSVISFIAQTYRFLCALLITVFLVGASTGAIASVVVEDNKITVRCRHATFELPAIVDDLPTVMGFNVESPDVSKRTSRSFSASSSLNKTELRNLVAKHYSVLTSLATSYPFVGTLSITVVPEKIGLTFDPRSQLINRPVNFDLSCVDPPQTGPNDYLIKAQTLEEWAKKERPLLTRDETGFARVPKATIDRWRDTYGLRFDYDVDAGWSKVAIDPENYTPLGDPLVLGHDCNIGAWTTKFDFCMTQTFWRNGVALRIRIFVQRLPALSVKDYFDRLFDVVRSIDKSHN
jgi:hypothetical protein